MEIGYTREMIDKLVTEAINKVGKQRVVEALQSFFPVAKDSQKYVDELDEMLKVVIEKW